MREIKYQAFLKQEKMVVNVVEINLEHQFIRYYDTSHCKDGAEAFEFIRNEEPNAEAVFGHIELREYTGLKDKNGLEIYEGDITELEVEGEIRRFVVNIKTVVRDVVSHPSFYDETAKVAITGVVFEWNGFELFPCVDDNGQFDNTKMVVVGNVCENPELLEISNGSNRV